MHIALSKRERVPGRMVGRWFEDKYVNTYLSSPHKDGVLNFGLIKVCAPVSNMFHDARKSDHLSQS